MEHVILPFIVSMLLGGTIDLTTYKIGRNVYDYADYTETQLNSANTTFMVLQDSVFPYSYMGLPIDIVLRIKTDLLSTSSGLSGLEGLLKQIDWKSNSVVVAAGSIIQTVQRTLKKDASLLSNWRQRVGDNRTHYVNSMVYGGWRVILFRFKCDIPGDVQIVRRTLTSTLGAKGKLEAQTIENWNKAINEINQNKEIRGRVRLDIDTFSTVPLKELVETPDDLLESLNRFPNQVGELGQPIFMDLLPLHDLDPSYPSVEKNHGLNSDLHLVDKMYDDVKNTKQHMVRWLSHTLSSFTVEEEEEVSNLLEHINTCVRLFEDVISEASIYSAKEPTMLKTALLKYITGLKGADSYDMTFKRLKEQINDECKSTFLHKIRGLLNVSRSEKIELGKVKGGIEECKAFCIEEPKCRAIGYADHIAKLKRIESGEDAGKYKMVNKRKQCWIYFRSSSTAHIITPEGSHAAGVYDRVCH